MVSVSGKRKSSVNVEIPDQRAFGTFSEASAILSGNCPRIVRACQAPQDAEPFWDLDAAVALALARDSVLDSSVLYAASLRVSQQVDKAEVRACWR